MDGSIDYMRRIVPATQTNFPVNTDPVLLLHMDGTNGSQTFIDATNRHIVTAQGNAHIDTSQKVFGTASGLMPIDGDALTLDNSEDFIFGTGDFTLDCLVQLQSFDTLNGPQHILDFRGKNYVAPNIVLYMIGVTHKVRFYDGFGDQIESSTALSIDGIFHHIALTRAAGLTRLFFDGINEGITFSDSNSYTIGKRYSPVIGGGSDGLEGWNTAVHGWMDEVRVLKGIANWTSNFTPPTSAYSPA